jgi:two-component system, NtrC family, nitrogen regulation sensor histidine kinase NtrY
MRRNRRRIILAVLTVVMLLVAMATESVYFSDFEYRLRTRMFNKILSSKEKIMEDCLNGMQPLLASNNHHGSVSENNLFSIAEENNITILEYLDNKLHYWSDNGFDVPSFMTDSIYNKPLIFLQNGWFLTKKIQAGNESIVGLLRLHTDYGFENNIIKSGFAKEFRIAEDVGFSTDKNQSAFHILDKSGEFLFSLIFPAEKGHSLFIFIPLSLWVAVFILIILLTFELAKFFVDKGRKILAVGFVLLVFCAIYSFLLLSGKPAVLFHTELFSPYRFSLNYFLPSLGQMLLISVLGTCLSYFIYRHIPIKELDKGNKVSDYLILTFLLAVVALLFSCSNLIFSTLIRNSNINFETYKIQEINFFSIIGFSSILLFELFPALLMLKIFQVTKHFQKNTMVIAGITSTLVPAAFVFRDATTFIPVTAFYILILVLVWLCVFKKIGVFNLALISSVIFGFFSLALITVLSEEKIAANLKIQAISFSTENDPEAELLILDLWPVISKDTTLASIMKVNAFDMTDFERITNYLQETYFTGYWRNFYFNSVPCRGDQLLNINEGRVVTQNCFTFFEDRIRRDGRQLTGTDFYFIDNQGGRSYYIGKLFFKGEKGVTNGLFIELYSDLNMFQPGYSELLLDKNYHGYARLKDYSFAKYINGEVVLRTGDFPYDKTDADYIKENTEYKLFKADGFNHVLYKNGNATILISRPELTFGDITISFSYLFAYTLLFLNLILLIIRRPDLKSVFTLNFSQKLQMSFIGVLVFSFILIGYVVSSLTIGQYVTRHNDNLKEKLNSVYLELEENISNERYLSNDWRNMNYSSLNDLLIKLSNVFETDINMYDLNQSLIATSRPEIFFRNLTSRRMNNMAYTNLDILRRSEYFQKERIGSLEYLSAYLPFFNTEGKVIAYLNLPYFRMQSVLAKEISNLIVAVINFTLLLILITTSIAVFISGRITAPLTMLGEGLASVEVGKKSKQLSYKGKDEIGELVKQYNRMVDEIEESTHKLANSEREYAWREMAKQIAHEIKNPLTPMKLNVQQLLKSWKDKAPGFDRKLEQFTENQIEYIDNLSSIASAFSAFAKMPGNNPAEVNIIDQIKTTLGLFRNTDNITFRVQWPHETKVIVYADKEHINGIFSNLFKNGIQSIPSDREGVIKVQTKVNSDTVVISVSDNGTGIPEELQKRLFTPNFTTKTSGMGLGLSIVKRYIENANGKIWFESEADKGSTFYVELPLMYTVEKPL